MEAPKELALEIADFVATSAEPEQRGSKCPIELEVPVEKRVCIFPALDITTPFMIHPKVKDTNVPMGASAFREPYFALSLAKVIMLPVDKEILRVEDDVVAIALVAQSAILAIERIVDIGRNHRYTVNLVSQLNKQVSFQKKNVQTTAANFVVATEKTTIEQTRTEAEHARAVEANKLCLAAEERAMTIEMTYKVAEEKLQKVMAQLIEVQQSTIEAFKKGEESATNNYAKEALKFENRGFKQGWTKAFEASKVTLDVPIPFENEGVDTTKNDTFSYQIIGSQKSKI